MPGNQEVGLFGVKLTRSVLAFLVTHRVRSALSRRFADNPSKWITSEWLTIRPETALYGTSDQQVCVATKIGFRLV
jgi:hypothetical protein